MIQYPHVATGLMAGQGDTELPDPKKPEPVLPNSKFFMGPAETKQVPPNPSVELIAYDGTKTVDNKTVPIYVGQEGKDVAVENANITDVVGHYNFQIVQKLFVYFKIPKDQHPGTYEARLKDGPTVIATEYVEVLST